MSAIRLSELLRRDVPADPVITGVTADSRKVAPGSLFVALPGSAADGRAFIPQALSQGAAAVLAPADTDAAMAPVLVTSGDVRRAYAIAARSFYGSQPAPTARPRSPPSAARSGPPSASMPRAWEPSEF